MGGCGLNDAFRVEPYSQTGGGKRRSRRSSRKRSSRKRSSRRMRRSSRRMRRSSRKRSSRKRSSRKRLSNKQRLQKFIKTSVDESTYSLPNKSRAKARKSKKKTSTFSDY